MAFKRIYSTSSISIILNPNLVAFPNVSPSGSIIFPWFSQGFLMVFSWFRNGPRFDLQPITVAGPPAVTASVPSEALVPHVTQALGSQLPLLLLWKNTVDIWLIYRV